MLSWTRRFNIFSFLDNSDCSVAPRRYDCLLAAGAVDSFSSSTVGELDSFLERNRGWVFGHLSYELKNSIHHLVTRKKDPIGFPELFFFVPSFLLRLEEDQLHIQAPDPAAVYAQLMQEVPSALPSSPVVIQPVLSKTEYLEKISQLQKHIVRGDCYEINFCQEFFARDAVIDPVSVFQKLTAISPNPFSAFYRVNEAYLLCASPERYLMKQGTRILSQPMKGTIKRDLSDAAADENLKNALRQSAKDRSENVMVVDMVRNDLTKICSEASVKVDELFGVYSYPQVHQMISTISGELKPGVRFSEIIEASFPMGSMTGAPKHRVMELIDQYEEGSRGIFSGSVGYINPERDFDFNVVIRSIMYNSHEKYLSYQAGSGITFYSDPEGEWEECLLKASAIKKVLTGKSAL